ncbi:MAG: Omp28-related outer membrane protein [Melioribacteraceae bacterium]|nr:Omp28-related outer membrane protein [Melioribacteraceae bacterium]MCF8353231.1 Omp28-related outer membrane protein [Melioribacteraceae bacterium]MCF8393963.1 Omp28-related outer membrane protein [Melioribacteraceae bacterium]MCF8418735.1 Omp28-related outer membrane protein [Melioribacteraceae bacterium]
MKNLLKLNKYILAFLLVINTINLSQTERISVLEYVTGNWCPSCACGYVFLEDSIYTQFPNTIILAYHGPSDSGDPFAEFEGNDIIDEMEFFVYPSAVIDRTGPPQFLPTWDDTLAVRETVEPTVEIIPEITYNSTTSKVNIAVEVTALTELQGEYSINYIITEDSLNGFQSGSDTCPGDENFTFNNVVRSVIKNRDGGILKDSLWLSGETVSHEITHTLVSEINVSNANLIIFVNKVNDEINSSEIQQAVKVKLNQNVVAVNETGAAVSYKLFQNYPNPFNPVTSIKFFLPVNDNVELTIYDILGRKIITLLESEMNEGYHEVNFSAVNLTSGIYFYRLQTSQFNQLKKMTLLK